MSGYHFDLATEADDADLRRLMRSTVTPGDIEISFRREPSFFQALTSEGYWHQVVTARRNKDHQIVGCGVRSIQSRYVDGVTMPVGYLSSLRLDQGHRGIGLVRRGYCFMRELHQDRKTPFYLTTIASGNDTAERLLTTKLRDMPRYHPYGCYFTMAISPRPYQRYSFAPEFLIRSSRSDDTANIIRFLNDEGSKRMFSNHHSDTSFLGTDKFKSLDLSDVLLAFKGKELVGVLGGWDQHSFRQVIVHRYNGKLHYWRRPYGLIQRLRGGKSLPKEGQAFRYRLGTLCLIKDWNEKIFCALLEHQLMLTAREPYHYFLLGMHETDPLYTVAQRYATVAYKTNLYIVNWGAPPDFYYHTSAPIHLELGCL